MNELISLPDGGKNRFFLPRDIIRLEASGSYTIVYSKMTDPFKCAKLLHEIQEKLDPNEFFRVHKSHVVNAGEIREYERGRGGKFLMSDGSLIQVASRKKCEVLKRLSGKVLAH